LNENKKKKEIDYKKNHIKNEKGEIKIIK